MNINELEELLKDARVPERFYSIGDMGIGGDIFCIRKDINGWEVYYSERGAKFDRKVFTSEDEACQYFYGRIIRTMKIPD